MRRKSHRYKSEQLDAVIILGFCNLSTFQINVYFVVEVFPRTFYLLAKVLHKLPGVDFKLLHLMLNMNCQKLKEAVCFVMMKFIKI